LLELRIAAFPLRYPLFDVSDVALNILYFRRLLLFPSSFRGELGQYIHGHRERRAVFLFESNRLWPFSTRRVRQIIHQYAAAAGIEKRVYPHLFRHQIITFLTRKGIISPKLQLLSGHAEEKSLAIYRDLALADVSDEYE